MPSLKFCASMREQIQKKIRKNQVKSSRKEGGGHKKQKSSVASTSVHEMQNLLLSQIKASEKIMTEIKSKLIDSEYKLQ